MGLGVVDEHVIHCEHRLKSFGVLIEVSLVRDKVIQPDQNLSEASS